MPRTTTSHGQKTDRSHPRRTESTGSPPGSNLTQGRKSPRFGSRPGPERIAPDLVDPDRRVMVESAAARRATRRLPLGEPPLVITTHAITSFRSSLPGPAGDQPRARAGSSPSRHGSAIRKSADRVCSFDRQDYFIRTVRADQPPIRKSCPRELPHCDGRKILTRTAALRGEEGTDHG